MRSSPLPRASGLARREPSAHPGCRQRRTRSGEAGEQSAGRGERPEDRARRRHRFLLGRGYGLVWSGWDSGASSANNGLGARFPTAIENGRPITGQIRHEFHIGTRAPGKGDIARLPFPAVSTDTRAARLTVRDRESDTRTEIPVQSWAFVNAQSIRLLPSGSLFAPLRYPRAVVRGRRVEGARHRVCRGARPRLLVALRA